MIRKIFFILLSVSAIAAPSLQADSAQAQVEKLRATVNAALDAIYADDARSLSEQEKQSRVRSALESNYDLTVIIRRTIGRNWSELDATQQERVLELVKQLVVKAYVDNMSGGERPEISYGEPIQITDKRLEIPSTIRAGDTRVSVLYRLGRLESGWQIYDVVAEDISLVSNYRQQIDDHFRKGNAAELITRLEELLQRKEISDETIEI